MLGGFFVGCGRGFGGFIFLRAGRTAGASPALRFERFPREGCVAENWYGGDLPPPYKASIRLAVFLLVVGEGLVVLSFCVRDERREQAPALHY